MTTKHRGTGPLAVLLAAMFTAAGRAGADTYAWNPATGSGTAYWDSSSSWTGNAIPPSSDTTEIVFGGGATDSGTYTPYSNQNISATFAFDTLTFNSDALAYDLSGDGIYLYGGITQDSDNTITIASTIGPLAAQTWTVSDSTAVLDITGNVSGNGTVTTAGAGTITLAGTNSSLKGLDVSSNVVLPKNAVANITTLTVGSGGTLNINSGATLGPKTGGVTSNTLSIDGGSTVSAATMNLASGGTIATGGTTVGNTSGTNNVFNQTGGTHTIYGNLTIASAAAASGTYNLSGGTLIADSVDGGAGSSTFNFNGGTLEPNGVNGTLIQNLTNLVVQAGGGTISLGSNNATINQAFVHDPSLGSTPDGGMTFVNGASLTLTGASTYTGPTIVESMLYLNGGSLQGSVFDVRSGDSYINGTITAPTAVHVSYVTSGTANGEVVLQTGSISTGEIDIASANSTGYLGQTGGTLSVSGNMNVGVGGFGSAAMSAGSTSVQGSLNIGDGGTGNYELSGTGSLSASTIDVGYASGGYGSGVTQSGGTNTVSTAFYFGVGGGEYILSGGTLQVPAVQNLGGTAQFDLDGGTLQANQNSNNFLSVTTANVQTGGAVIDTNGYNITITQPLLHDTTSGAPVTDGGLTKNGAGTLTLASADTYAGGTTINSGTLNINADTALGAAPSSAATNLTFGGNATLQLATNAGAITLSSNRNVSIASGIVATFDTNGASNLLTVGGAISGGGGLAKSGAGTLVFHPFTSSALSVNAGVARLASNTSASPTSAATSSLSVASGAMLDLTNNDLIVHGGSLTAIQSLVDTGYNSGTENGSGIITSTGVSANRTLGVMLNNNGSNSPIYTTFDGQAVTNTDVLVKYTLFGDANLDGTVDAADFVLLSNNFGKTGTTWSQGDFNDDGTTDAADFVLLSNNFGQSLNSSAVQYMDASELTAYNAIAAGYGFSQSQIAAWDVKLSGVPEPGMGMVVLAGLVAGWRRRR